MSKLLISMMMAAALLMLSGFDVQAAKTFKIGLIMPLSGQLSSDGTHEANGVKMAVEDINAQGGIKVGGESYKIDLIVYDDQGIPKESVAAMEKLVTRDGAKMVIGAYTSSSTFAIMPIAQREKIVLCSPNSAATKLTQVGNKWFFRGGSTTEDALKTIPFYIQQLGAKSVVHVCVNDDWGRDVSTRHKIVQEKIGIKVLSQEFYDHGTSDFYSVLTKIKGLNPDAIFTGMETKACSIFVRQAKEVVPQMKIVDTGGVDPYLLLKLVGEAGLVNVYCANRGPALEHPPIVPIAKRYREKYNMEPMSYVLSGYDVAMMFKNAVEKAGTVTDTEKIQEAMTKTNYNGLIGRYYYDKNNELSLIGWVGDFKGGKVNLWPFKR